MEQSTKGRARTNERAALKRAELDAAYVQQFARQIRLMVPGCPPGRETAIAEHACLKYSGRVGRSSTAEKFGERAIRLAVLAHLRHTETSYDRLLMEGLGRSEARMQVESEVSTLFDQWRIQK